MPGRDLVERADRCVGDPRRDRLRFLAIGDVTSWLGFPVGPEVGAADGVRQTFLGGNIWWSNHSGGAWETHGAINDEYWRGFGPQGWYGFPVSPEYGYYGGMRQDFEHGSPAVERPAGGRRDLRPGVGRRTCGRSWRPGCPVGPESLTLIRLNYWGFDNAVHRGEIIVRSDLAGRVASVFGAALTDHYPIRQMWRVDYFGGDDPASMAADNTSGFNCRQVTGGSGLSPHSYGIAIDINTVENPYYAGGRWWPNTELRRPQQRALGNAITAAPRDRELSQHRASRGAAATWTTSTSSSSGDLTA